MDKLLREQQAGGSAAGEDSKNLLATASDMKALAAEIEAFRAGGASAAITNAPASTNIAPRQAKAVGHTSYMGPQ